MSTVGANEEPVVQRSEHPTSALTDLVHQRGRLGILAVLAEVDRADFTFLKNTLGLTDGNLSRHIDALAGAGFVHVEKGYAGRRPRTWIHISKAGRRALEQEMNALRELVHRYESTAG